jgi:serine/threonine protein kinase
MNQDVEKQKHKNANKRERSIDHLDRRGIPSKNIGQFILGEKLGEGTFGKVVLGTHILTGEKVTKYYLYR